MNTSNILITILATFALVFSLHQPAFSQPYYYMSDYDSGGTDVNRLNLRTNVVEMFLRDTSGVALGVSCDKTQRWVFLEGESGPYVVVDSNNPADRREIPLMQNVRGNKYISYTPEANRFYVEWNWEIGAELKTYVFDASTLVLIDSLPSIASEIYSADGSIHYKRTKDTVAHESYIDGYSTVNNAFVSRKNELLIGPPTLYKFIRGVSHEWLLYSYIYPLPDTLNRKYQVYNLVEDITYPPISFPPRSKGYLSGSGRFVIIEEVRLNPDDSVRAEYRPGSVYIYESETGNFVSHLSFPPDGEILLFPNHPDTLYYYLSREQRSINVALAPTILPIELWYLSATVLANAHVQLDWGTISETNNYGFEVQESMSATSGFTSIAGSFIPGHGTTLEPHEYSYTDQSTSLGTWYYRLKQIDLDGALHYTDPVQVYVPDVSAPTQIANFTTTVLIGDDVRLDWMTLVELNNSGFYIQNTNEATGTTPINFQDVSDGFVSGQGTTNEPFTYTFTHKAVAPGLWYYRLKQVDLDNTEHYSDTVEAKIEGDIIVIESITVEPLAQQKVQLEWTTRRETNNARFVVEVSRGDSLHFRQIPNAIVPGHGTTTQTWRYSYRDANRRNGVMYYRLKQVSTSGRVRYTRGVKITVQ